MLVLTLYEKCPNPEFFLVYIIPYAVQIRENMDQKNSVFETLFTHCNLMTNLLFYKISFMEHNEIQC